MQAEYAEAYRDLYRRHWWWRAREEYLVRVLRRYLPSDGSARLLDVGCGGGLFFHRLAPFGEVMGVETDRTMRSGDPALDERIHWGSLDTLPPGDSFDGILMLDVLEHMPDPTAALRQARARLSARGVLVATVPAFQMLWTAHDDMNEHVRRYVKRTFRPLLEAAGLRPVRLRYFFHWTFPAKLLVRAAERVRGARRGPPIPPVPPHPVNRALYALSRAEQACLGSLPVPFGSSLLAVARPER